jgi:hypothetical protein
MAVSLPGCFTFQAPSRIIRETTVRQQSSDNGFAYYKAFSASGDGWYKIAVIKNNGNLGKQSCAFKIYSTVNPQNGVYYASYFMNLRLSHSGEYYGKLFCTNWGKDNLSGFVPDDVCVTYGGHPDREVTATIWKRAGNIDDAWAFGVEFAEEGVSLNFAENSYYGTKDYMKRKPSVADGYGFVIDVSNPFIDKVKY